MEELGPTAAKHVGSVSFGLHLFEPLPYENFPAMEFDVKGGSWFGPFSFQRDRVPTVRFHVNWPVRTKDSTLETVKGVGKGCLACTILHKCIEPLQLVGTEMLYFQPLVHPPLCVFATDLVFFTHQPDFFTADLVFLTLSPC